MEQHMQNNAEFYEGRQVQGCVERKVISRRHEVQF